MIEAFDNNEYASFDDPKPPEKKVEFTSPETEIIEPVQDEETNESNEKSTSWLDAVTKYVSKDVLIVLVLIIALLVAYYYGN